MRRRRILVVAALLLLPLLWRRLRWSVVSPSAAAIPSARVTASAGVSSSTVSLLAAPGHCAWSGEGSRDRVRVDFLGTICANEVKRV